MLCSFLSGFAIGLLGTWIMRKEQAYERAMLILALYIPISGLAFIAGALCQWWQSGLCEAVFFVGVVGWQGSLMGMLVNMCSRPPPKKDEPEDELF